MSPASIATGRHAVFDRMLWLFIGGLGLFFLLPAVVRPGGGHAFFTAIGLSCLVLGIVGTAAQWGPLVPCMVLGALLGTWFAADILIGPVDHHPGDDVLFVGGVLAGVVGGAILGGACERSRMANVDARQNAGDKGTYPHLDEQSATQESVPGPDSSGESSPPTT